MGIFASNNNNNNMKTSIGPKSSETWAQRHIVVWNVGVVNKWMNVLEAKEGKHIYKDNSSSDVGKIIL